jgi:hypothetical protein
MSARPEMMSEEVRGEARRRLDRFGLDLLSAEDGTWGVYKLKEGDDPFSPDWPGVAPLCRGATVADLFSFLDLLDDMAKTLRAFEPERSAKPGGRP